MSDDWSEQQTLTWSSIIALMRAWIWDGMSLEMPQSNNWGIPRQQQFMFWNKSDGLNRNPEFTYNDVIKGSEGVHDVQPHPSQSHLIPVYWFPSIPLTDFTGGVSNPSRLFSREGQLPSSTHVAEAVTNSCTLTLLLLFCGIAYPDI